MAETMTAEAIERVARAIVARRNLPEGTEINWPAFIADARAAIAAMQPEFAAAMDRALEEAAAEADSVRFTADRPEQTVEWAIEQARERILALRTQPTTPDA